MIGAALLILAVAASPEVIIRATEDRSLEDHGLAARVGQPARFTAVVKSPGNCWAERPGTSLDGHACESIPAPVAESARWFVARPRVQDYDNTIRCTPPEIQRGCHEPISYDFVEVLELRGALSADARNAPLLAALGSHRIAVKLKWEGREIVSRGLGDASDLDRVVPEMFEILVRRDDTYVGYLSELFGVPFVLGPARVPGVGHQTDRRLGADCVALVIYGRRRLGEPFGYVAPRALKRWMTLVGVADALVGDDDRVADVGMVRPGDVLDFGFQTAVLSKINSARGRLEPSDLVIHTFHGVAEEVHLCELPYRHHRVEVLRWPEGG
jgi:hypothetical protein